jgi:proteic killer suppression protein
MVRSFIHRGLQAFYESGSVAGINPDFQGRLRTRLGVMNAAETIGDLRVPGFNLHPLNGLPLRYSIHVNGPWCLTFEWVDGDIWRLNLENYH